MILQLLILEVPPGDPMPQDAADEEQQQDDCQSVVLEEPAHRAGCLPGESQIDTRHATLRHRATTMAWPVLQFRLRMTEIRPATVDDAQVIAAIYAHHVRHR